MTKVNRTASHFLYVLPDMLSSMSWDYFPHKNFQTHISIAYVVSRLPLELNYFSKLHIRTSPFYSASLITCNLMFLVSDTFFSICRNEVKKKTNANMFKKCHMVRMSGRFTTINNSPWWAVVNHKSPYHTYGS